jgi:diacylglycerol kinase (ATP)
LPAKVILNPYAGRWTALQRRQEVEEVLKSHRINYDLVSTEYPEHGVELAAQAARQGYDPIIAAGGDGSISEVVNGIMQATPNTQPALISVGIIPLGSANDFCDNMGIPKEIEAAVQVIQAQKRRTIDLGLLKIGVDGQHRFFDNNAAIGLEPYVTVIQERITRMRGVLRYLLATLMAVWDKPQWIMRLEWDGGSYHGPISLVTVGNLPRTGGLFYMTPHADAYDQLLTFVYGFLPTRRQILKILPRTMKPGVGSYVEHPSIHEVHTGWLKVMSEQPTPAHADGVVLSKTAQEVEYQVLPNALRVLVP